MLLALPNHRAWRPCPLPPWLPALPACLRVLARRLQSVLGQVEVDLGSHTHDKAVERFGVKKKKLPRGVIQACARVVEARLRGTEDPAVDFPAEHEKDALELLRNMGARFGVSQGERADWLLFDRGPGQGSPAILAGWQLGPQCTLCHVMYPHAERSGMQHAVAVQ
jgi:hypothetical protein